VHCGAEDSRGSDRDLCGVRWGRGNFSLASLHPEAKDGVG
jgi:hypothetical protein